MGDKIHEKVRENRKLRRFIEEIYHDLSWNVKTQKNDIENAHLSLDTMI